MGKVITAFVTFDEYMLGLKERLKLNGIDFDSLHISFEDEELQKNMPDK